MSVTNVWDDEAKTIIRQTFVDPWTWEELNNATREAATMMQTRAHPVDLLLDLRQGQHVPPDALSKPGMVAKQYPPNWRLMIVVADNHLIKNLVTWTKRLFSRPFEQKLYYCPSLEEAYQLIKQRAQTPR